MTPNAVTPGERIRRARRIGTTFGRVYLGIRTQRFIARRLRPPDMKKRWTRFHHSSAKSIYATAIELRGLILKGCQFIGSRADVLPPPYIEVLSELQDRVPPKPFPVVCEILEAELGCDLESVFASFERRPIASASLAQVHEARLHSGERVAVKVQYPEIAALVTSDLANLRLLFRAVGWFEGDFDLMPLVDELGQYVPLELDFENEGRNAELVSSYFEGRDDIVVPRIHWEYSTKRVLVMEYMEGVKITDIRGLSRAGIDVHRVAELLIESFCEQILVRGVFHADPHPGNLLVQATPDGPRLVLLDFGLVKDLPPGFRQGIASFAVSLLRGDAETMADALLVLGFETRDGKRDSLAAISRFVLDTATRVQNQSYLDRDLAEQIGADLNDEIRHNPIVRVPSHIVLVARVLGLLSGVNRSLSSKIDLVRTVLPYALSANANANADPTEH